MQAWQLLADAREMVADAREMVADAREMVADARETVADAREMGARAGPSVHQPAQRVPAPEQWLATRIGTRASQVESRQWPS